VFCAGYIIYLLCLWDVESIILIYPPGSQTLALNIFNFLHYGHNAQVNALCVTLLTLAVAPLAIWQLVQLVRRHVSPISGHETRNTHYVSAFLLILIASLASSGCSPPAPNESPVPGRLFSRVRVI